MISHKILWSILYHDLSSCHQSEANQTKLPPIQNYVNTDKKHMN